MHGFDRLLLIGRFLERERRGELLGHRLIDRQRDALPRLALRVDREQFGGDVAHFLRGLSLRALPRVAAERMQRREFRRGAGVAADEMQLRNRHVELVALGVFDGEEFAALAADVELEQALIAADAVIDVHDRRADRELAEIADDRFRIARGALATAASAARARRAARVR